MDFPLLTLKERDRRWALVRSKMAEMGLDVLVVAGDQGNWFGNMANVRYLTGIGDQSWAVFPLKGDPVLLTWWSTPNASRTSDEISPITAAIRAKQGKDVRTRNPWALEKAWVREVRQGWPSFGDAIVRLISDLGLQRSTIGLVGTSSHIQQDGLFPMRTYLKMQRELPGATILDDVTWIVERARLCKSAEEIACIEKASDIADRAIECLVEYSRPGMDEAALYAKMAETLLREGSERSWMCFWTSGQAPAHVQLFTPTPRVMQQGDFVITEITPRYGGYLAHPHQPISLGEPIPEIRKMYDLLRETRDAALAQLRPGVTVAEQEEALMGPIRRAGYSYLHLPIHGMGMSLGEWPNTNFWGNANPWMPSPDELTFEEGMLLAYEPMISTPDRKFGLPLGDTVLITRDGARRLSRYCNDLIVV